MKSETVQKVHFQTTPSSWVDEQVSAERARLFKEAGLIESHIRHYQRPMERAFTREERGHVTILYGGFTNRHDELFKSGLEGLGYKAARVPMPTKADFQTGKEYGNNAQCNPTYFTVGALVNYLKQLRDEEGIPTEDILKNYIFVTGGACGPCRFGMYEAEYRLALGNAGFDGFRILIFDQEGGYSQSGQKAGLEMNSSFFLMFLNGVLIGDLLNAVASHIRTYEVVPGKTEEVFNKCLTLCQQALRTKNYDTKRHGLLTRLFAKLLPGDGNTIGWFLDQVGNKYYVRILEQCRQLIDEEIEVDYTRPKPIVKIMGEFWAQTTEGDGNFNMFPFLEGEGAELLTEPVTTYVNYTLNAYRQYTLDRRGLSNNIKPPGFWNFGQRLRHEMDYRKTIAVITFAQKTLEREFNRLRHALGGTIHPLTQQLELQRIGHPFYNSRIEGGEGHLEVAKNIYYINRDLAHMVLSLKPFGCMPSTQSDGAQAAVIAQYPDIIYLPVETSGEGDINAHSRAQMALGEAKLKCKDEFKAAVAQSGYALEEIRTYIAEHRELRRPLQHIPHTKGVAGRAANFVLHVARLMDKDPAWSVKKD